MLDIYHQGDGTGQGEMDGEELANDDDQGEGIAWQKAEEEEKQCWW